MKQFAIYAFALAAILAGCSKMEDGSNTAPTEVVFTLGGVQSGPMTKSVADLLTASAPSGTINLRLRSTTDNLREYQVQPGQAVQIIPDTYTVNCQYVPQSCFDCVRGKFYLEPRFSVNTEVTITTTTSTYQLPVIWECFAIVKDDTKVASVQASNSNADPAAVNSWNTQGGLSLVYAYCASAWDIAMNLQLTTTPVDETRYQATTWRLTTAWVSGCLMVQNGYWYLFTPDGVQAQNGTLALSYPSWTEGITH